MSAARTFSQATRKRATTVLLLSALCAGTAGAQVNISPTAAQSTLTATPTDGTSGSLVDFWVSIIGGASGGGWQLFYFSNPFDGSQAFGGGLAVGPSKPAGVNPWSAGSNSTYIGAFASGTQLTFGALVNGKTWYFTGDGSQNPDGLAHFYNGLGNTLYQDDHTTPLQSVAADQQLWGVEGVAGGYPYSDRDFNDFAFAVYASGTTPTVGFRNASVAPEPATLALLGSGLAGLGGVGFRRRKRTGTE